MTENSQPVSKAEIVPLGVRPDAPARDPGDYPVREYVGVMSAELARMARNEGDAWLANALDIAVELASRAPPSRPEDTQA